MSWLPAVAAGHAERMKGFLFLCKGKQAQNQTKKTHVYTLDLTYSSHFFLC